LLALLFLKVISKTFYNNYIFSGLTTGYSQVGLPRLVWTANWLGHRRYASATTGRNDLFITSINKQAHFPMVLRISTPRCCHTK